MEKTKITKEEARKYRRTLNGQKKHRWMRLGIMIDLLASLGVGFLIIYANKIFSEICFYAILYILLVIIVIGGELIGVYFGAKEQYFYNQQHRREIDFDE